MITELIDKAALPETYGEVRLNPEKYLRLLPEKAVPDMRKQLQYVEKILPMFNLDGSIPMHKLLNPEGLLPLSPGEINERLVQLEIEKLKAQPIIPQDELDQLMKVVGERATQILDSRIAEVQNRANAHLGHARNHFNRAMEHMSNANAANVEAAEIRERGSSAKLIQDEVSKILENPFWEYLGVGVFSDFYYNETNILFRTRNPITLSMRNQRAGISIDVPMGMYEVRICIHRARIHVRQAADFANGAYTPLRWTGNCHPFISSGGDSWGNICWGNASNEAAKLIAHNKWGEVMGLLQTLLSTYHQDSSPYMALENYDRQFKAWKNHGSPTQVRERNNMLFHFFDDTDKAVKLAEAFRYPEVSSTRHTDWFNVAYEQDRGVTREPEPTGSCDSCGAPLYEEDEVLCDDCALCDYCDGSYPRNELNSDGYCTSCEEELAEEELAEEEEEVSDET